MSQVNMAEALRSPALAKQYLVNYYKQNNTLGITSEQVGELEYVYSDRLANWLNSTAIDDNHYEIDDDDWNDAVEDGVQQGKDTTGYENSGSDKAGQIVNNAGNGLVTVLNVGARVGVKIVGKIAVKELGKEVGKQAASKVANAGILIACAMDAASAGVYKLTKPNKTQDEVVQTLTTEMDNQQAISSGAQENLVGIDGELADMTDAACFHTDDANTAMYEDKGEYDFYAKTLEYLEEAKTAGHEFTEDEAKMYEECIKYMTENSENVAMTQDDAEAAINEIHDEMEGYQSDLDGQAESIANVQGVTDYAAGIDESQKTQCYVEQFVQYANMGLAGIDAAKAGAAAVASSITIGGAIAYGAAAAVAGGAAFFDGKAAAEQKGFAGNAETEIKAREATQELNTQSQEVYNQTVDNFALDLENVEGLELEVPDDIEAPTGETPTVGPQNPQEQENPEDEDEDEDEENS